MSKKKRGNEITRGWMEKERGWIPQRERFGGDKLRHTYCNWQRRGGSMESNDRRRMRRTKRRRSIRAQRGTGSSMPVSTTWPLPALGIPNPVITQNTQGLTRSRSQHHFPLGCFGLCGTRVSAGRSVVRLKSGLVPVTLIQPVCLLWVFRSKTNKNSNLLTCSGLSRQLDSSTSKALGKFFLRSSF